MPRNAREHSASGIYHVFIRGINRQAIFEEDDDFCRFLVITEKAKTKSVFSLYGYCLMDNHVHLLLRVGNEDIGQTVKRITTAYAMWFNWKYDRTGHLFQDRFGSEPVETDEYVLQALRYIHNNPIKAKICRSPERYRWSSYQSYLDAAQGLTDTDFVEKMITSYSSNWKEWFIDFSKGSSDTELIDVETRQRLTDELLRNTIFESFGFERASDISTLSKEERDSAVRVFKEEGFGLRQIVRVTGIPYGIVRRR